MLAVLAVSAALVTGAADVKSEAWVVVGKRSGVAKPAALEMAKTVSETLSSNGVPNTTDVADLSTCNGKLVCLVEQGQKKKVSVLVTVEAASVLDDVVIHVEALSLEEDGKKLAVLDYEGPARQFSADAAAKAKDSFIPALRAALGISAAPIAKPEAPPKVIAAPAPEPRPVAEAPPPEVVKPTPPSQGLKPSKIAGIAIAAAGVVAIGIGSGMGVKALGDEGRRTQLCPANMPCTNPAAYAAYEDARGAQNLAIPIAVVGGVLAAGGVVLFLLDLGGGEATVSPSASPNGAGVTLSGTF